MEDRIEEILQLAKSLGLDPYPIVYETVERATMFNVCAYGLPTRAGHWSYGRSYDHQKTHGEMGLSKVYEIILNSNPSYAFLLDTNSEVQNLFIAAHCIGHCFVPGTLVETLDGPKPIESVTQNDKVLTHSGRFRKPNGISKREYAGKLLKIKIGSQEIACTPEHPFLVIKHSACSLNYRKSVCKNNCNYHEQKRCSVKPYVDYKTEWVMAKDLAPKDFLVFPKTDLLSSEKIDSFEITGQKGEGHPGGIIDVRYELKVDEKFGEFLGLYLAEGYARTGGQMGLCFHTDETLLHDVSRRLIRQLFDLKDYDCVHAKTHSHQILFNEKVLSNWLRNNCGNACDTKHVPDFLFKSINKKFASALLRGLFHGDGYNGARSLALTTTSIKLASQVRHICLKYNIKTNIKILNKNDRKTAYVVTISGLSRKRFAAKTSLDWNVEGGNRGFEFCWFDENNVYTSITNIEEYYDTTSVFNLDIQEDSSYVLFAGAITHNSDFFKNNCMFKGSNRNMIRHAAQHAGRIEEYIDRFGFERVEHIMDIGFALDNHIDWNKGLHRKPYGQKHVVTKYRKRGEFDDLLYKKQKPTVIRQTVNDKFPPRPEKDLLWFLINYAPLDDWERDILDIIREESFYFYPQKMTKIMNEGWASYWHAELMFKYENLTPEEHMDFVRDHERVVQPGMNPFRINPYFLGYRIFKDIEKRWDKEHGKGAGREKIFQVRCEDDDISFLRNYLTPELVEELKLFTYGYEKNYPKDYNHTKFIIVKEKLRDEIVETMVKPLYNGGAPKISIVEIGQEGGLVLKHESEEISTLDFRFAEKTIGYLWDLWTAPIEIRVKDDSGNDVVLCFDEAGPYRKEQGSELSFDEDTIELEL